MSSAACCASSTWGSRRSTPRRTWTCWLTVRRSEEHTSELQSRSDLVCRLLLEKKKKKNITDTQHNHNTSLHLIPPHAPGLGDGKNRLAQDTSGLAIRHLAEYLTVTLSLLPRLA